MSEQYKCPTCSGYIPNNENIGAYAGAISRKDNKTEICSACGTREAMEDWVAFNNKISNLIAEQVPCPECERPTEPEAIAQWQMCHDCDNQLCAECSQIECDHAI
jgi:hypothetical protein